MDLLTIQLMDKKLQMKYYKGDGGMGMNELNFELMQVMTLKNPEYR